VEDYFTNTKSEMAELLVQLRDLAQSYDESDVTRILGGLSLANVGEQREAFRQQVQDIRTKIEALLRVTAVWTYAEYMVFRRIQERSFMFIENLSTASEYEGDDDELLKLAENYRQSLIECIDKTLHYTDNLTKSLPTSYIQTVLT
jgi:hypothetical protein